MRVRIRIEKRKKNQGRKTASKWIAAGALAAVSATGGDFVSLRGQTPAGQVAPQSGAAQYTIASGPLKVVLEQFQKISGWRVDLPDARMELLPSTGVQGKFRSGDALQKILAGTGLTFETSSPGKVVLRFEAVRSSVEVVDRSPVTSPRYTEPLRNIPQTITVIPRQIIEQQGATSLTEVMRNVPGLTITAGEGGVAGGDNLTLRGNSARNDIFVDGVRDLNPQSRDPFNLESVEVTKGPTSAITGRGSSGGAINLVSKSPTVNRFIGGSLALGNANTRRGAVDINVPLRDRIAFRLNGLVHDSEVAGRNAVKNDRWGWSPSLAFGLGTPTRATLSYYKLKQGNVADYGIPWVPATNNALLAYRDKPAPVPRDTFYGFADRDREVLNQDTVTARVEHDFTDVNSLRSQFRYGKSGRNSFATPPRFASNDSTVINRELRSWYAQDKIWDSQTDARLQAKTFGVQHNLVTGFALTRENNVRINRTGGNSPTTLLNPNPADVYTGTIVTNPNTGNMTANTQALWAFDTAKIGNKLEATGGLRWERFDVNGISTTPAPVAQLVNFTSLRGGLIYKPTQSGSVYASYGNSVSPSLEGLSYSTSNTAIPPEKTYTSEVGTKWEFGSGKLLLTSALFRVAKDNARTPGLLPTDPPQVLAGRQVSQGFEFSATGAITRALRILGSYSLIDARIKNSNTPAEVGRFFQNTPRNSATAWLTYTAQKFMFGLGPRFVGKRFGNNTNTRFVDSYATLDIMGSYRINRNVDLRVNVSNMNNSYYFERLGGGHLVPGASRYVLVTTNFKF